MKIVRKQVVTDRFVKRRDKIQLLIVSIKSVIILENINWNVLVNKEFVSEVRKIRSFKKIMRLFDRLVLYFYF